MSREGLEHQRAGAAFEVANAPAAPPGVRRTCLTVMLLIFGTLSLTASTAILNEKADFEYFYRAGAWLLDHGTFDTGVERLADGRIERRGTIEWYLPFVSQWMTVVVAVGRLGEWVGLPAYQTSGFLWLGGNLVACFALLRLIGRRLLDLPPQDWMVTTLMPVVLTLFFWHWEFRLNQVDTLTLLLIVAGFVLWRQGRGGVAGFWLGLAVLLKVTPALLLIWFVLKRAWRTVIVAGVTIVLAGPVSGVLAFGPDYAVGAYRTWVRNALERTSHSALVRDQREMDWRNQGLGAVLSRWLHETDYATRFENDPRIGRRDEPGFLNVANLPVETVGRLATGGLLAGVAALLIFARRPARELTEWRLRTEFALVLVVMLCAMPVLRRYHLIGLTPVLALLFAAVHHVGWKDRWSKIAMGFVGAMFVAQWAILPRVIGAPYLVEAAGAMWFTTAGLVIPLVLLARRTARRPQLPASPVPEAADEPGGVGLPPAGTRA